MIAFILIESGEQVVTARRSSIKPSGGTLTQFLYLKVTSWVLSKHSLPIVSIETEHFKPASTVPCISIFFSVVLAVLEPQGVLTATSQDSLLFAIVMNLSSLTPASNRSIEVLVYSSLSKTLGYIIDLEIYIFMSFRNLFGMCKHTVFSYQTNFLT